MRLGIITQKTFVKSYCGDKNWPKSDLFSLDLLEFLKFFFTKIDLSLKPQIFDQFVFYSGNSFQ